MMRILALAAALILGPVAAQAQTINNLGAGGAVQGTDLFPTYQGANPAVSIPASALKTFILPNIGANTVLGSIAGGAPTALTQTQLTSLINPATAALPGALPAWPNDATKFFGGDGNYRTALTQITFGSGTSGVTCTTTCSVSTAILTDAPSSGAFPYAIPNTDWGKGVVVPASGGALTIAAASTSGFGAGFFTWVMNEDTASHTLTPTTSTISGKSSVPIPAGDAMCMWSDGSNYHFCLPPALSVANNLADLASASTARTNLGLGSAATANTGTSGATVPLLNGTNTWSGAQTVNSGDLLLAGSGSGTTTLNAAATASGTLTLPAATDTLVARATTDSLTNKTLTSSTNSLGGVTASFGSDAKGDIYTNGGSSNVITRLAIGSTGNCLLVASALPSWGSCLSAPPLATGSSTGNTVTGPNAYFVCTAACTVTPPVPVAGYQFCVMNDDAVTGVITLGAIGSSARYENTARTAYGTAGTGTLVSGGAVGDMICIVGRDSTHYLSPTFVGTWTAS
jgi:hypothetical protein